jgi:hypothetical protein
MPNTPILPDNTYLSSNNSDYSPDYNDHWNRLINNSAENHEAGEINDFDDDDFIQGRELTLSDLNNEVISEEEDDYSTPVMKPNWAESSMPPLPDYEKQYINVNSEGFDPMMMETLVINDYLSEDKKDNIAILYVNKIYLTSRSIIEQQENDALVYECLEGDKKTFQNIVGNLPLYNIKKIGLDLSSDAGVGIEPEYIYISGIDALMEEDHQLYSIIPLPDKQLVSVISFNEAQKVGTALGSGVSALHCQSGQGGLAGIIVKAYPSIAGGRKKKKNTIKKKKNSKRKTMKKKKRTLSKKLRNKKK